ncbi:hypothetical protein ACJ73_05391 [Blastomyces percursus]|uniref:Uncharacterized protein n=1 Tax=Blastomyces percursus TaxID=1658174 RepID=A0A1J9R415_9EURO|nr:hypothetical protein ACJ73_05391 [Blastomyces percursus]
MSMNASNEAFTNYLFKYTTALLEDNHAMLNIESGFGNTRFHTRLRAKEDILMRCRFQTFVSQTQLFTGFDRRVALSRFSVLQE